MNYIYTALFTPLADGSGYNASVPDLPGCVTSGQTLHDAMAQIMDAASVYLVVAEDESLPIPSATPQHGLSLPDGALCSLIEVDTIAYRSATDTRCVRKNVSLPAWMASMAEKNHINVSQVLQDALSLRLSAL